MSDEKNPGYHPLEPEEGRDNHPHTDERRRDMTNEPHEGEGNKHGSGSGNKGVQQPEGASPNPEEEDASGRGNSDHGHRTNYGGFGNEAGGQVGDRRSIDDWSPDKHHKENEQ